MKKNGSKMGDNESFENDREKLIEKRQKKRLKK